MLYAGIIYVSLVIFYIFNCKIISGEHIFNQKSLFECVNDYYIVKNEELKDTLKNVKNLKNSSLVQKGSIEPIIKEINGNWKSI